MRKLIYSLISIVMIACSQESDDTPYSNLKPRLVVMTDIGPSEVEPDDNESMVRLLSYADRFEIEGIFTTIGWNCDPYPTEWTKYLTNVTNAYAVDVKNLMKRSGQTWFKTLDDENRQQELGYWPSAQYISSRCMMGSQKAGIDVIGEGNDSPGSEYLIKLADEDDPRPIWIASWGGANTLAQAIWKVKKTRTAKELKKFLRKFRIYTITDQDMHWAKRMQRDYSSHMWLRDEFKDDLKFVWDESAWLNQNELGKMNWKKYETHIQGHGEMGKNYPQYLWGVEGDTPSFLHVMPNGLNDPEDPQQVSWGGYHTFGMSPDSMTYAWTNWYEPVKGISDAYEKRFYDDIFNDFAARMAWAHEGKGNTNPSVIINGKNGIGPINIKVKSGKSVTLDASDTFDAENDSLEFAWWIQPEAGTMDDDKVTVAGMDSDRCTVKIANDVDNGETLHIICEVHDDGDFRLVSYRRVIITIVD